MNHFPRRVFCVLPLLLLVLASVPAPSASLFQDGLEDPASGAVDWLSDEFDNPASLSDFQRVWRREHWPFDQLQLQVIGQVPGRLTMQPHSSGWYEDYRGELTYKELSGDVVATTLVYPRNAAGTGAPGSTRGGPFGSEYSLAFLPKVEIELWVDDARCEEILRKVVEAARTGRMGDGKIFVLPVKSQLREISF